MNDPVLAVEGLTKRFGALIANEEIDIDVRRGEVHAVIGPNGAGKTTFISQLAGELPPDTGRIALNGRDITALPVHRRALLGMARSYQIPALSRRSPRWKMSPLRPRPSTATATGSGVRRRRRIT